MKVGKRVSFLQLGKRMLKEALTEEFVRMG